MAFWCVALVALIDEIIDEMIDEMIDEKIVDNS